MEGKTLLKQRGQLMLLTSIEEDQLTAAKIVTVTSGLATLLPLLPYKYIGENRVLVFISKEMQSIFHAFVVFLMLSFATSFSSLYLSSKWPKAAKFCKFCSITYLVSAMASATYCFFYV
ncbi:hypothetical protein A4A49_35568 [Nicotiana attenuata]|uniref:Uncharacterized protein n=1 Tax=Nicotiana attenuata TaxID=49451 RepID=A0A1J6JTP1_NICAT|nr:hypothetical protein A4A49_35568 [Nicotiana attenuata]